VRYYRGGAQILTMMFVFSRIFQSVEGRIDDRLSRAG
jgi:hypothetical protein